MKSPIQLKSQIFWVSAGSVNGTENLIVRRESKVKIWNLR